MLNCPKKKKKLFKGVELLDVFITKFNGAKIGVGIGIIGHSSVLFIANNWVYIRIMLSYPTKSPHRRRLAASQLSGDDGSGLLSSNEIARMVDFKVQAGDHAVFNKSKHISPVCFIVMRVIRYVLSKMKETCKVCLSNYLEMNVGVTYLCNELDGGRLHRIVMGDFHI